MSNKVIIKDEFGVYEVEGRIVDKVLRSYVLTGPDAIINFVYMLKERGLEDKLRNIGVKDGDVVRVAGIEFDFLDWTKCCYWRITFWIWNCKQRYRDWETDRKSTRLNSSHRSLSRMPSSA